MYPHCIYNDRREFNAILSQAYSLSVINILSNEQPHRLKFKKIVLWLILLLVERKYKKYFYVFLIGSYEAFLILPNFLYKVY